MKVSHNQKILYSLLRQWKACDELFISGTTHQRNIASDRLHNWKEAVHWVITTSWKMNFDGYYPAYLMGVSL